MEPLEIIDRDGKLNFAFVEQLSDDRDVVRWNQHVYFLSDERGTYHEVDLCSDLSGTG